MNTAQQRAFFKNQLPASIAAKCVGSLFENIATLIKYNNLAIFFCGYEKNTGEQ